MSKAEIVGGSERRVELDRRARLVSRAIAGMEMRERIRAARVLLYEHAKVATPEAWPSKPTSEKDGSAADLRLPQWIGLAFC